jgi:hypothetical protein
MLGLAQVETRLRMYARTLRIVVVNHWLRLLPQPPVKKIFGSKRDEVIETKRVSCCIETRDFALATSHYPCGGEMKKFVTEWKSGSEKRRESIQSFGTDKRTMRPLGLTKDWEDNIKMNEILRLGTNSRLTSATCFDLLGHPQGYHLTVKIFRAIICMYCNKWNN